MSSSEIALTGLYPPSNFTGFQALHQAVKDKLKELDHGGSDQYISLNQVSQQDFESIDDQRNTIRAKFLLTYFVDIETLIVKVPSHEDERAHRLIDQLIHDQINSMNVSFFEFMPEGSTRYVGPTQSEKEGDSTRTNTQLRPGGGWPYFVIQADVSESGSRLRQDAAWWFSNSSGDVRLVLLIKVDKQRREATIDKYDRFRTWSTRTQPSCWIPRPLRTIVINQGVMPATCDVQVSTGTAIGPALTLEFDLLVGRAANLPLERDVVFTAAQLIDWCAGIFQ